MHGSTSIWTARTPPPNLGPTIMGGRLQLMMDAKRAHHSDTRTYRRTCGVSHMTIYIVKVTIYYVVHIAGWQQHYCCTCDSPACMLQSLLYFLFYMHTLPKHLAQSVQTQLPPGTTQASMSDGIHGNNASEPVTKIDHRTSASQAQVGSRMWSSAKP